jgi:hypothetical protein
VNESINKEGTWLVSQFVVFELQLLRAHSITTRISRLSSVVVKVIYGWLGWPNETWLRSFIGAYLTWIDTSMSLRETHPYCKTTTTVVVSVMLKLQVKVWLHLTCLLFSVTFYWSQYILDRLNTTILWINIVSSWSHCGYMFRLLSSHHQAITELIWYDKCALNGIPF